MSPRRALTFGDLAIGEPFDWPDLPKGKSPLTKVDHLRSAARDLGWRRVLSFVAWVVVVGWWLVTAIWLMR